MKFSDFVNRDSPTAELRAAIDEECAIINFRAARISIGATRKLHSARAILDEIASARHISGIVINSIGVDRKSEASANLHIALEIAATGRHRKEPCIDIDRAQVGCVACNLNLGVT